MTKFRPLATGLAVAVILAACGGDGDTTNPSPATGSPAGATPAEFPVTIENCGRTTAYDAPPERAITMNQHVTEVLLALGLQGRMVGTAYMDSTIRPDLADAYETVPLLAAEYPSKEQVLAAEPDMAVGGFASAFEDEAAGTRDALADLDIDTYLTAGYCPDLDAANTLDLVYSDITNLGAIFGVPDRAAAMVEDIRSTVAAAAEDRGDAEPVDVFVYDSGTDKAFTAAGYEMTTALIAAAGGRNIFADVHDTFTEVSWEDVVDRDPDLVLILNYGDTTVEQKQQLLSSHPVASTLRAVREQRYVVVDLTDVVPGIRNGDAVAAMASAFHPPR